MDSNTRAGLDWIEFAIPGSGVRTISPLSALPDISDAVRVDGTSQPGYAGVPLIELSGLLAGSGVSGLSITAARSTILGLAINAFDASDILVSGAALADSLILEQLDVVGVTISGDFSGSLLAQSPGFLDPLTITGTLPLKFSASNNGQAASKVGVGAVNLTISASASQAR